MSMNTLIVDKSKGREYLRRLREDPVFFVHQIWLDRGLDNVHPLGEIEDDMIRYAFTGPRLRGILGPRGIGKTTMITAPLIVFRGFRDGDRKILTISKSQTAAKEVISLTREWLDKVWFLQHMAPRTGCSDTTNYYDFGHALAGVSKQPSVKALGNDGQLEGNRAHTVIPDDMETKANTKTLQARLELRRVASECRNVLYPNRGVGVKGQQTDETEIVFIGTIKCEDSLYKDRADKRYAIRTYPLAYPQKSDYLINLAPIIQHKLQSGRKKYTLDGQYDLNPVFPHRFGEEDIREKMAEGAHEFAMEHMLIANLADEKRYPLRLRDLIVHDCPRNAAPITIQWGTRDGNTETIYKGCMPNGIGDDRLYHPVMTDTMLAPYATTKAVIDVAGSGEDRTGLAIAGYLNGNYWVKFCRGMQGGADELTLRDIALTLREHGASEAWVETNVDIFDTYAPALEVQLRKLTLKKGEDAAYPEGWSCKVLRFRTTGTYKEDRICSLLQPVLGAHRIIVDPRVVKPWPDEAEHQTFQYQLTRIQRTKKCLREDGALDALASLIARFQTTTSGVATDPERERNRKVVQRINQIKRDAAIRQGLAPAYTRVIRMP